MSYGSDASVDSGVHMMSMSTPMSMSMSMPEIVVDAVEEDLGEIGVGRADDPIVHGACLWIFGFCPSPRRHLCRFPHLFTFFFFLFLLK